MAGILIGYCGYHQDMSPMACLVYMRFIKSNKAFKQNPIDA